MEIQAVNGNCGLFLTQGSPFTRLSNWRRLMVLKSSQESLAALQEQWRGRLEESEKQYRDDRTRRNREALLHVLRVFTDLVVHGKIPIE